MSSSDDSPAAGHQRAPRAGPSLPRLCFVGVDQGVMRMLADSPGIGERKDGTSWAQLGTGGAERQLATLGRLMRSQSWPVSFVVGDWGQQVSQTADGIRLVTGYRAGEGLRGLRFYYPSTPRFWYALGEADADIYISRGLTPWAGLVALFSRRHRKRYVLALASGMDVDPTRSRAGRRDRWLYRQALRHADGVVAQHAEQLSLLKRNFGRDGRVIGNVVSLPEASPKTARDPSSPIVLWVGNLKPVKRVDMLVEVARRVPEARFVAVGFAERHDGGEGIRARLREVTGTLDNLEYADYVAPQEMPALYGRASVLLHTSEPGVEGFPNVLLEAWHYGVPTVSSSSVGGVIERDRLGTYCEGADQMAESVRYWLGVSAQELDALAARARRYLQESHSPERVTAAYADVFLGLARV